MPPGTIELFVVGSSPISPMLIDEVKPAIGVIIKTKMEKIRVSMLRIEDW